MKTRRMRVNNQTLKGLIALLVIVGAVLSATVVQAQPQQDPPPSVDDVGAGIFTAGGPNVDGLIVEAEANPDQNSWVYHVYLDGLGRPVTPDANNKRYRMEINLYYMRDGSGGYCWKCVILIADLRTKLYTNGGSNSLSQKEWDDLMDGRPAWKAFNDPETCRRYDATLDRNVLDAVKNAFANLNDGMTGGTVRTHTVKTKSKSSSVK